jgi:hypothetical protein
MTKYNPMIPTKLKQLREKLSTVSYPHPLNSINFGTLFVFCIGER